jgi:flagellar hook-associated protein 2
MALSSPGIGSNLDINGIISKLMQVEAQPLAKLATKEASHQAKLSAFGTLKSALSSFQSAFSTLNEVSKFDAMSITSSGKEIVTASVSGNAVAGTFDVKVTQLAQAQTIATAGQASMTAPIGSGAATTINIQFGTIGDDEDPLRDPFKFENGVYTGAKFTQDAAQTSKSITIDSSNNTLQGIRDAINKANLGVTASLVSDGSATPHHLVLTSSKTGAASSMKVSVDGDSTLKGLLTYDPGKDAGQALTQSRAGQNTLLTVNGIAVSSASTTVTDAIQGVTLNALKAESSTITVTKDTASTQASISGMVKAYNELNKTVKTLTAYDATTKQAGILLGDSATRQIQTEIRSMLSSPLKDASGAYSNLSQIGLTFQVDGTMVLDSGKLKTAIESNFKDVAALFATMGSTTDSLVAYTGSTSATKPGTADLHISSLATQGKLVGTKAVAGLEITKDGNDKLTVTVDGVGATITLVPGTYTATALAAHLQSLINGASEFTKDSISVTVTADADGILTITSNRYGSASKIAVSGSASSDVLGAGLTPTDGTDVVGTIGNVVGAGSGQFLTGAVGSHYEGLKLRVIGGDAPAARGTVTFSQGYAFQLGKLIDGYLGSSGLISARTDGINSSIKDIGKSREAMNTRLAAVEKRYRAQFTALDSMISSMNQTSAYLSQQLAQISNMSKNS